MSEMWHAITYEDVIWILQAVLEEADIRIADIKKAGVDFEKDVVKTIIKKKGSIIASNKVMRYMEEKIRSRVSGDKLSFFSSFCLHE